KQASGKPSQSIIVCCDGPYRRHSSLRLSRPMSGREELMSKNESLLKRRAAAVARGVGQIHPIVAERAENATVWDVDGREYIDFAGGIAVLNTGHLHPKVVAAVQEQLTKLSHTCFQVLAYEPYIELCEEIAKRVPGD